MNNNKGFTLIELLAVIIILGVLMLVAIPSVTNYINNSRKNVYIDTAKQLLKGATNLVNSGELDVYDIDTTYYIPSGCIKLETGGDSPYGKFDPAYVVVTYDNDSYSYYWTSRDETGIGIKKITLSTDLEANLLEAGIKENDITTNVAVGSRSNIKVLSLDDCKSFNSDTVTSSVDENGNSSSSGTNSSIWDVYYHYNDPTFSVEEYNSINPTWETWAQVDNETGVIEFCVRFPKGPGCIEINKTYDGPQNKLQNKRAEFESLGAVCGELNNGEDDDFDCSNGNNGEITSHHSWWVHEGFYFFQIHNEYCGMWYEIDDNKFYCN